VWVEDTMYDAMVTLLDSGGRLTPAVSDR